MVRIASLLAVVILTVLSSPFHSDASAVGVPTVSVEPDEFCGNPKAYQGVRIVLRGVQFKKMIDARRATFGTKGQRDLIISALPTDQKFNPGDWYDVVVSSLGFGTIMNEFGSARFLPHAMFVGLP